MRSLSDVRARVLRVPVALKPAKLPPCSAADFGHALATYFIKIYAIFCKDIKKQGAKTVEISRVLQHGEIVRYLLSKSTNQ